MKQIARLTLIGYLLLLPYCMFGAMIVPANAAYRTHHSMPMEANCIMPSSICPTTTGDLGGLAHHFAMYNTLTHTALGATLALFFVLMFLVFIVIAPLVTIIALSASHRSLREIKDGAIGSAKQELARLLSLFETSPNFA